MHTLATFGSCRVSKLDPTQFQMVMGPVRGVSPTVDKAPHIYHQDGKSVFAQPCGYSLSIEEHLDLIEVFCGERNPIPKSRSPFYEEVHKYSPHPLIVGGRDLVDTYLIELCSRKWIRNTPMFQSLSDWEGRTIPYKILNPKPSTYGIVGNVNRSGDGAPSGHTDRAQILEGLKSIVSTVKRPPKAIHVIGPYWWDKAVLAHGQSPSEILMPPSVREGREALHEDIEHACEAIGVQYHKFNDILKIDSEQGVLTDSFHLSPTGVRNFTEFVTGLMG